jgi:hypothetical protein
MGNSIPGTDLRSIPDFEAIAPIRDMEAVEKTGGKASDIQLEEEDTMNEEIGPEQHAEIMSLVDQLGAEASIAALTAAVGSGGPEGPGGPEMPPGPPGMGGPGGPPPGMGGGAPGGPQGILSNLA